MRLITIDRAKIVGYSDPLDDGPRFVFPVFCADNDLCFAHISADDKIVSFAPLALCNAVLPATSEIYGEVDQTAVFAFYPGFGDVLTGDRLGLTQQIDSMLYLFAEMPFVLRTIHRFAGRTHYAEALLTAAQNFLARDSRFRAEQWAASQRTTSLAQPAPSGKPLPKRLRDSRSNRPAPYANLPNTKRGGGPVAERRSDFSLDDFDDDETRALQSTEPRPDLTISKAVAGSAKVKTTSGFITVNALIGPRGSSVEFAACKIISSPRENLLWSVPLVPIYKALRPTLVIFMQCAARGKVMEHVFRKPVQDGVATGIYRCVDDDTLPQSEASDVFVVLGVDITSDEEEGQRQPADRSFSAISRFFERERRRARETAAAEDMLADTSIIGKISDATYHAMREAIKKDTPYSPPGTSPGDIYGFPDTLQ